MSNKIKRPKFPKPAGYGYSGSGMSCYHYTEKQMRKYAADRVRYELARQAGKLKGKVDLSWLNSLPNEMNNG